jgi:hypothetical protein
MQSLQLKFLSYRPLAGYCIAREIAVICACDSGVVPPGDANLVPIPPELLAMPVLICATVAPTCCRVGDVNAPWQAEQFVV